MKRQSRGGGREETEQLASEQSGEHRGGIWGVPRPSDTGSYRGAGIRRISQATRSGGFCFTEQNVSHKDLFLRGTGRPPPAGTQTPEPSSSALRRVHGERWVLYEAELRNHALPSLSASSGPGQSGSGGAPGCCSCNRPPDKRADPGLRRLWSTARHPVSSPLPAGHSWEVWLPPLEPGQAKNPIFLFPGKLFQVPTLPSRCDILQRARPPRSRPRASPSRLPHPARCQAWIAATPRTSTNTPAAGRGPAGRKLPGKERGRHHFHLGAGSCRADFPGSPFRSCHISAPF